MTTFRLCRLILTIMLACIGLAGVYTTVNAEALPPEKISLKIDSIPAAGDAAPAEAETSTFAKLTALTSHASQLALQAVSMLGIHYKYGGNNPENGLDCSGLVRYVYKETLDKDLPRTAAEISHVGQHIDPHDLRPGDLVFYNTLRRGFSHVGIYLGDNKFIHSPSAGGQVRIESMDLKYWKKRFNGARRIDDNSAPPPAQ
ncbi:MAG TPA: C40 family peptidase [Burkholderiaceae bacterium]|jgi:cell wall-associated NlpC family hydrolase|nr:C40 family peptidase [Burkholderiaceae bacterium]